jgi:2,4-dienoyl-CoA reductase-like NADH-dependent reductase (Old Yellow Enzyme family)
VRAEVGEETVLFVRFSATDWVEGGWNEEETSIVTDWVKDLGADTVDISTGGLVGSWMPSLEVMQVWMTPPMGEQ